jgi:DNA-binding transcriptional LysR family regulator
LHLQVHNTRRSPTNWLHHEFDLGLVEGQLPSPRAPRRTLGGGRTGGVLRARACAGWRAFARRWPNSPVKPWIVREAGSGTRETLDRALRHHPAAEGPA